MLLSEAMRKGAAMKPQAYSSQNGVTATCALQAACDGVGLPTSRWNNLDSDTSPWPWLNSSGSHHFGGHKRRYIELIWELNDTQKWTREAIADWVATIEPQEVYDANTHGR